MDPYLARIFRPRALRPRNLLSSSRPLRCSRVQLGIRLRSTDPPEKQTNVCVVVIKITQRRRRYLTWCGNRRCLLRYTKGNHAFRTE